MVHCNFLSIMDDQIHPNYKPAAYLIFAAIAVDLINGFIQKGTNPDFDMVTLAEVSLMFLTFGYFAFIGKDWIKWVILLATILTIFPIVAALNQKANQLNILYISQFFSSLLKFSSFIILSLVPKKN
ncbi:hypothetical protein SAMN04488522_1011193 [Pedobacter caeni]|uniref:DoxX-like family protein n=2 Tax=Pedobacter caeni TaxID=288992 RepID=A0A1M4WA38_9SPHI|nr:hypothetical protein SAMN04488522_1011193 [Pedobacter caeni]